jgi:hypothetical protein
MKSKLPAALVAAFAATASAPLEAAVLVDLDATSLSPGALPTWINSGSLPGNFTGSATVPQVALTTPGAGGGNPVNAVRFTGSGTFYSGPIAPNSIGGQGARSIEVWAMNPATVDEESLVSWGHRGGPAGTNLSFNWGHHGTWGAVGHWDAPDMPWLPQPAANQWHHLVYTYDGATVRLYVDGQANNSRALTLNTHQGFNIVIAGQNNNVSPFAPVGFNADLSIAKVKVHDTALSLSQVRTSYNADASLFGKTPAVEPPDINTFTVSPAQFLPGENVTLTWNVITSPAKPLTAISIDNGAPAISGNSGSVVVNPATTTTYTLTATNADGTATASRTAVPRAQPLVPKHRWSFNNAAGSAANGSVIADSIGGAAGDAFVRTNGSINATFTGTEVTLPGGASASAPYVDLPNGILSTRSGDATFEGWVRINGVQNWARLIDFGSSLANAGNEILAPGSTGNGDEYLILSASIGTAATQNRFELREGGLSALQDPAVPYTAGQQFHIAVVYDQDGGANGVPQMRYYRDGSLLSSVDTGKFLSTIRDNNNWLGRSNFMGDANLQGAYDEFRVYDGAMAGADVAASMAAGPDAPLPVPLHVDLFGPGRFSIYEGESTALHWKITDPLNSTVTTISPGVGTVTPAAAGSVGVMPAVTTTYTLTTTNGTDTRTALATVTILPTRPVTNETSFLAPQNGNASGTLTATDPRGLPLTWTLVTPPAHGSLTGTLPGFTYTPAAGYSGSDSMTVQTNNGTYDSNLATIRFHVRPDIPRADALAVDVPFQTPKAIRLTALDPDNEALTWSIVSGPSGGILTGTAPNVTYTPAAGFTGADSFTFKVNDGTYDSNVAVVSLNVCQATAPVDIVLSDLRLRTDDTVGTMISRLSATDPGCQETHSFALVGGAGSTNNADFTISGNQLIANRDFSAALNQTVSIRLRVTDQTGQSFEKIVTFTVGPPDLHVKINEVFYNSPNNKIGAEFIELYNPFGTAVDVSNWRLSDGVEYVFPPGASIPAGGYLVVAQNPATVAALWGITPLGPWSGGLSSDGENIELRDASNARVDEVDYGINTPWPVPANGDGPSLELVNPSLDNDLGGNWKAASASAAGTTYVAAGTAGWRYRPGSSEASAPVGAWRAPGFAEDATWRSGTAPIGLFKINNNVSQATFTETGVVLGTQLTAANAGADMATYVSSAVESTANYTVNYQSVFFRREFTFSGTPPSALFLRVMHNDAAIVYINGTEVARFGFAAGAPADPPFNFQGTYERGNDPWSELILTNASSYLVSGTNTLAVQGWAKSPRLRGGPQGQDDANLYNVFDFAIDAHLGTVTHFKATPGVQNSVHAVNGAPAVRNVEHSPAQPDAGDPITVTARISDRQGLGSVELRYQIVTPGSFIPAELPRTNAEILGNIVNNRDYPKLPNAAFELASNWITLPMSDDGGTSSDTEGDGIYTAVIPPQPHRTLVRYRVFATDLAGAAAQVPSPDDPSRNFAVFVYNGVPPYTNGAFAAVPEDLESLPVYHWIMRPADFNSLLAYNGADQFANNNALNTLLARRYYNFEGALVYDGRVYDHVEIRLRGGNSRYQGAGKRHFRFSFPQGYAFKAKDNKGRPYPRDWEDMLFNKLFGNKGDYDWGLPYIAGEKLWGLQGVPMPYNHWVHFRVIRTVAEAGDAAANNDFWGLYQALEHPDGKNFEEARDLPKGNFYKMSDFIQNGEMDERYQAPGAPDFAEDFDNIRYNIHPATPQADMEKFVHMPLYYKYNAVQEAIRHYDIFIEPTGRHRIKNLYWYFHPGDLNPDGSRVNPLGQCWFMPYDWDASFGPNWNGGFDFVNNAIYNRNAIPDSPTWGAVQNRTAMQIQHRNAFREFRDLVFHRNDPGSSGPVDDILEDAAATLEKFWTADQSRWPNPGANSYRTMPSKVEDMKAFCFTGWSSIAGEPAVGAGGRAAYLDSLSDTPDAGQLGATPSITYTGAAGYPLDQLSFSASAFSDPQDGATFTAIQWRAGEIAEPTAADDRIYEAVEVWGSGELAGPSTAVTLPPGALREGRTYRVRARYRDSSGRFTHWSAPHEFTAGASAYDQVLTENLHLSEIMYKPAPPTPAQAAAPNFWSAGDFEYVELTNRSTVLTLDLTNVRFTKGVDFDFTGSAITSLAPGATVLVVGNAAAFADRYGAGKPVAGAWDSGQNLANSGEQLKLSYGAGNPIHDITYDDAVPWPVEADNDGVSMVYAGPNAVAGLPDPQADGSNWIASSVTGGSPGTEEFHTFDRWMAANGLTDPSGDPNQNGWDNLGEWAFARDLGAADPVGGIVTSGPDRFLQLTYTRRHRAQGVTWHHEISSSLTGGTWSAVSVVTVSAVDHGDGTETVTIRATLPVDAAGTGTRWFIRARAEVSSGSGEFSSFESWMTANGLTDPSADANQNGWDNLGEWAFARDLGADDPVGTLVTAGPDRFLQLTYTRRHPVQGVTFHHEISSSLAAGSWSPANVVTATSVINGDGTETVTIRSTLPVDAAASGTRWYIRARAEIP